MGTFLRAQLRACESEIADRKLTLEAKTLEV